MGADAHFVIRLTMIDKITGFEAKDIPILNKALDTLDRRNPSIPIVDGVPVIETIIVKGMTDTDGDTQIQLEESADEDKCRIDTGGSEIVVIDSNGVDVKTGDLVVASGGKIGYEGISGDSYWKYNSATTYMELYTNGELRLQA